MANHSKLIEEDRLERVQSHRGTAKLYDGTYSHINPISARFDDNGVAKYVVLSDEANGNMIYLQGMMVKELYNQWKLKLGAFGPSEIKQQEEEIEVLHDVKLTAKQLEALHELLSHLP